MHGPACCREARDWQSRSRSDTTGPVPPAALSPTPTRPRPWRARRVRSPTRVMKGVMKWQVSGGLRWEKRKGEGSRREMEGGGTLALLSKLNWSVRAAIAFACASASAARAVSYASRCEEREESSVSRASSRCVRRVTRCDSSCVGGHGEGKGKCYGRAGEGGRQREVLRSRRCWKRADRGQRQELCVERLFD